LAATATYRELLAKLIEEFKIRSVLDAGCGDFHFMQHLLKDAKVKYIGVDIVKDMIDDCNRKYSTKSIRFLVRDITTDVLPACDAVIVKDVIQHLSVWDAYLAIQQVLATKTKWLLINHFPATEANRDTYKYGGGFYNLCLPPFNFPKPLRLIPKVGKGMQPKQRMMGLWDLR